MPHSEFFCHAVIGPSQGAGSHRIQRRKAHLSTLRQRRVEQRRFRRRSPPGKHEPLCKKCLLQAATGTTGAGWRSPCQQRNYENSSTVKQYLI